MSHTILLYGANGYSGQMIAKEGARKSVSTQDPWRPCRMILAGRNGASIKELAGKLGMEYRVFGLNDRNEVSRMLDGVDVVVNAAGPFAFTAERLSKVALEARVDYVDINSEGSVYRKLDDLSLAAANLGCTVVCGAGHNAGVTDLMLDAALRELRAKNKVASGDVLGSVRFAMLRLDNFYRGSAQNAWRSMRDQVTVVRGVDATDSRGKATVELALSHEPAGKIERTFDFQNYDARDEKGKRLRPDLRIASAADLVDTLSARLTVPRHRLSARGIESYVECSATSRAGFVLGSLLGPVAILPGVDLLARTQFSFLPAGPTAEELKTKHVVLLAIEDAFHTRIIDWRLETPNTYQLTAQIVVAVAGKVASYRQELARRLKGWRTPAEILGAQNLRNPEDQGPLRDCRLNERDV